jgi:spore maturation protein CgeB
MRFVCFYHSLVSDWNHGNAHFLRGVVSELGARGHDVVVYEPANGWSRRNLLADQGDAALTAFESAYPGLRSERYTCEELDLDVALAGADVVIVHEWTPPELVARIGAHHKRHAYLLLFHDTHHRMVTAPEEMRGYDLSQYDAVLAFGNVLTNLYRKRDKCRQVFTWHEAADPRVFRPLPIEPEGDLVWVGNWGDGERSQEIQQFLLDPCQRLGLRARVHGVRYPDEALRALAQAGVEYAGFIPNYRVPLAFAGHRVTVHVPRRPYVRALAGVPTIRMFEALACGIPLVSAPWYDAEELFRPGTDFLFARDSAQMTSRLRTVLNDAALRASLRHHGLETILSRHTCSHRVEQLLAIVSQLGGGGSETRRDGVRAELATMEVS